jgi:hypothetical protein
MKKIGNISFLTLCFFICISTLMNAQSKRKKNADKDTGNWRYEIECAGIGVQGTYLIKVWSYSKNPDIAIEQSKKNAVHGIIFKGFNGGKQGCISQKPLARKINLENEKKSFFKNFFSDGGDYLKFVSLSSDGSVAANDRLKVSKKEYKIGVVVSINKDELRKSLETAGVLKSLSNGF